MEYKIEELLVLVKELTELSTGKSSTSITYEAAQQLMGAVLYCIQENEVGLGEHELGNAVVAKHKLASAREAYDTGYGLITEKIKKANEIYSAIVTDFKDYGNQAYHDTVIKGIPEFFRWYDPRLKPQDHIITMDYIVLERLHELQGVDVIYRYLKCIQMEQSFLRQFPEEYVREVLITFNPDYEELLINLCEELLKKLLVNMLIEVKLEKIKLEPADYKSITEVVNSIGKDRFISELQYLLEMLMVRINQENQELHQYLELALPDIATELINAVHNNALHNIL